jgi:hypothetical protein
MANDGNKPSYFAQFITRPPPTEVATKRPQIQHAQRTLDFIQRWTEPTIRARDLRLYGPRPRNRENIIGSTTLLTEQGWLTVHKARRYDSREWAIVRKPVICPSVASGAD